MLFLLLVHGKVLRSHGCGYCYSCLMLFSYERVSVCVCSGAPGTCHGLLGFFTSLLCVYPQLDPRCSESLRQAPVALGSQWVSTTACHLAFLFHLGCNPLPGWEVGLTPGKC